ncbi:MAG TPA: phasin family protein [Prolixibacteraceae bacterium]|nr:phasin family protein [Prolixibacteraceae bacterium]
MESFMRKLMNTAFGTASMARKRATEVINDLMEQEKISEEEGRRIIEELNKEGEEQRGEFEKEIKTTLEKLLSKMNIPSKKEFEALEKRVEKLENPNSPNI